MVGRYIINPARRDSTVATETSVRSDKNFSTEILDLLNNLKNAIGQVRLHSRNHPEASQACGALLSSCAAFLEQHRTLVLASAPHGLLINGQRLGAKDFPTVALESTLVSSFLDAGIRSVSIRKGIAVNELLAFLD